jgi:hypothetical protein
VKIVLRLLDGELAHHVLSAARRRLPVDVTGIVAQRILAKAANARLSPRCRRTRTPAVCRRCCNREKPESPTFEIDGVTRIVSAGANVARRREETKPRAGLRPHSA